ncbi:MAG TPA: hypothetical protein VIT62_08685 [Lysobacter sp.]
MRHLIETTLMTYAQIAARTGVPPASICRWAQNGKWVRPLFAPRATDTVPRWRASAKLRRRTLAARLHALAERAVRELEASPRVDLAQLREALEVLKMTKLAERPRRRGHARRERASGVLTADARDRGPARLRRRHRPRARRGAGLFHRELRAGRGSDGPPGAQGARAALEAQPASCMDAGEGVRPRHACPLSGMKPT